MFVNGLSVDLTRGSENEAFTHKTFNSLLGR